MIAGRSRQRDRRRRPEPGPGALHPQVPGRAALRPVQPPGLGAPQAVHRARAGDAVGSVWSGWRSSTPGSHLAAFTALAVADGRRAGTLRHLLRRHGDRRHAPPRIVTGSRAMLVASRAAGGDGSARSASGSCSQATGNGPGRGDAVLWICAGLGADSPGPGAQARRSRAGPRTPSGSSGGRSGCWSGRASLVLLAFGAFYSLVGYGVEINLSPFYGRGLAARRRGDRRPRGGPLRRAGRRCGALAGACGSRMGRRWVLGIGVLALAAATVAPGRVVGGPWLGRAGRRRLRRGQRLDRRRLLRPGDGGVRPADGRLDLCPVHGRDEPQRRRRVDVRAARGVRSARRTGPAIASPS